jgi:flotillin
VHKITGDMAKMAAQVPALFEALSGMQMSELLSRVRLIGDKNDKNEKPAATAATDNKIPVKQPQA